MCFKECPPLTKGVLSNGVSFYSMLAGFDFNCLLASEVSTSSINTGTTEQSFFFRVQDSI